MTRKTRQVDRCQQFDFFAHAAPHSPATPPPVARTGRRFVAPDCHQLYLGMVRMDRHLEQAGLTTPLIIARLLDEQDWGEFESRYAHTGRAPYAPRAMMGLILLGILQGTNLLRGLEALARRDVGCMWVCGGICPDHASLGRFITMHEASLSGGLFESLTRSVLKVTGSGSGHLAGDGTVIEASCSRYKLLKEEAIRDQAQAAKTALAASPQDSKCQHRAALASEVEQTHEARKRARLRKGTSADSLVVSPSEPEAMVQPQKGRRGKAASYKPSVLANESRVIVAQAVDPCQEVSVLAGLLDQGEQVTGEVARELSLDAGYFCTQVIEETLEREISLLCVEGKQPGQPRGVKGGVYPKSQFRYIAHQDVYICPAGEQLRAGPKGNKTYKMYRTPLCASCALKDKCTKAQAGRRIRRCDSDEAKEALREVMLQPQAQQVYLHRQAMVEPVFSVLKERQGLRRFRRRGLAGVRVEFALHVLAYNLSRAVNALFLIMIKVFRAFERLMGGKMAELMNIQRFQGRCHC